MLATKIQNLVTKLATKNESFPIMYWAIKSSFKARKLVNNVVKLKSSPNFQTPQREHINIHHVSLLFYSFLYSSSFSISDITEKKNGEVHYVVKIN